MNDTINPKEEILEATEGEEIEAIELYVKGRKNKSGITKLVPKTFRGNKLSEALFLLDHNIEDKYGGCGVYVTAWTKSYVISSISVQDSQTSFERVDRNPPIDRKKQS